MKTFAIRVGLAGKRAEKEEEASVQEVTWLCGVRGEKRKGFFVVVVFIYFKT